MMVNSLRQLFRTKVKTLLFFLLIIFCALLICLGINLVMQCQKNLDHFKKVFMTIGTVEQTPVSIENEAVYDAGTKEYTYRKSKEYGKIFSISDLDMEGVTYISKPERRPFYQAYLPDYKIIDDNAGWGNEIIIEASPEKDCIPNGPVKMIVKKQCFCVYQLNVDFIYYCDHFTENPDMLYADKTYIMSLQQFPPHGFDMGNPDNNPSEYIQSGGPYSEQSTSDGQLMPQKMEGKSVEELNDEFYEKGHVKYWNAYVNELNKLYNTVPVTATGDLNLIMSFYNGDTYLVDGETFSDEDYINGNQKCIISAQFARRNKIKVGDKIPFTFRSANYSYPAIYGWSICLLNAEGESFEPFYESDYTVSGIYETRPGGDLDYGYTLAENEVFIPTASIKEDNADHICSWGNSVEPYNTSFRIPNGTIDEFMKEWEKKGIKDVTIHFYDKGYTRLEDGILQMERMAYLLLAGGIIMALLVVVFFSHLLIGGQKRRTAIERSLGLGKWNCMISLLAGIILVSAVGCMIGCIAGAVITGKATGKLKDQSYFDQRYSSGVVFSQDSESQEEDSMSLQVQGDVFTSGLTFIGVFVFIILVSGLTAWRNMKEEPLALLSSKIE